MSTLQRFATAFSTRWKNFHPSLKLVVACALFAGTLSMLPYVVHTFHPSYRSFTVIRDKDYGNYYSRLNRALKGHPEEANNGITPINDHVEGLQQAGMEKIVAFLFGWTGLAAPTLGVIVTGLSTTALFVLFYILFLELLFTPNTAFAMTLGYFAIFFGDTVTRVMHPGWSFIPTVLATIGFVRFWKQPTLLRAVIAGLFLGLLPAIYFWSWAYIWGIVTCIVIIDLIAQGKRSPFLSQWKSFALYASLTLLIAMPALLNIMKTFTHPLHEEISIPADILHQRTVESPVRTILLFMQAIALASLFPRHKREWTYLAALGFLMGIVLAMHQNFIHGRVLMFASHFYPQLVLSTLIATVWAIKHKMDVARRTIIVAIGSLFLLAGFYDEYRHYGIFVPSAFNFQHQHLLEPVALLDNNVQEVILSDYTTGRVVTAWTDDALVYTTHVRFLRVSDAEMAERYCLSELFEPYPPNPHRALYIEYNDILNSPAMRSREQQLVWEACLRMRKDPETYLNKYGVTHVLWNTYERPNWRVDAKKYNLIPVASGAEWGLWKRTISPR